MSTPSFFLEQTDFSLRFARCSGPQGARCIEMMREVLVSDQAALADAIQAVFQGATGPVIAAVRPAAQVLHLAPAAEARTHPGLLGVRQLASQGGSTAAWFAATQARDGGPAGDTPWLAALASAEDRAQTTAMFSTLNLTPGRQLSALHLSAGALAGATTQPALLLEIGIHSSHVLLIGRAGVIATGAVSLGIEQIAEAVQAELNLKYRGSAQKLFLNDQYDFSDAAAGIVARLAPALAGELAAIQGSHPAPTTLLCTGLPAKQQWFVMHLTAALKLAPFAPDFDVWCRKLGLSLTPPPVPADMPPLWLGFLQLMGTHGDKNPAWHAEWQDVAEPKAEARTAATAPAPTPAPIVEVKAAVVPKVVSSSKVEPAKAEPAQAVAVASHAPTPVATVAAPAPAKTKTPAKQPAPAKTEAATAVASAPVKTEPAKVEPVKAVPTQAVAAPVVPPPRKETPVVVAAPADDDSFVAPVPFYRKPAVIVAVVAFLALGIGGYFYREAQLAEAARLAAEKAHNEQRLAEETERARQAELKAQREAEERKKFEFTLNQKLAATEAARVQAENEARTQAAARLANARGRLVITTEPAGALVTVGTLPARQSPATFDDLRIGQYPVAITLTGHDSVQLSADIREDATTEPETVRLVRITGSLEIASEPVGADFELKPANALLLLPGAARTGRTPATFDDLATGEYTITYRREGWAPHSENVTVSREGIARSRFAFPMGSVKITSAPVGATVSRDGRTLGVTPLTVEGLAPGDLRFDITMSGFQSGSVQGRLDGGGTLELRTALLTNEGVTLASEIDSSPVPLDRVQPAISERFRDITARVDVEIIVDKTGAARDAKILSASNPEIDKACIAAALRWKFKPAMAKGQPVAVRVTLPFNFKPN